MPTRFETHIFQQGQRQARLRALEVSAGVRDTVSVAGNFPAGHFAEDFRNAYFGIESIDIRKSVISWHREFHMEHVTNYFQSQILDAKADIAATKKMAATLPWKFQTVITCGFAWIGHATAGLYGALFGVAFGSYLQMRSIANHMAKCAEDMRILEGILRQLEIDQAEYQSDRWNVAEVFSASEEATGQPDAKKAGELLNLEKLG